MSRGASVRLDREALAALVRAAADPRAAYHPEEGVGAAPLTGPGFDETETLKEGKP